VPDFKAGEKIKIGWLEGKIKILKVKKYEKEGK